MWAVEFRNVTFTYWQTDKPALCNIDLSIPPGQFVVLTGPTGAGKSTLLKMINGLIPNHMPGRMQGEVLVSGKSTKTANVAELASQVGLVFEDPDIQIVSLTVEDDVAFGPSNLGLPSHMIRERIQNALKQTRLTGFENRNPFTLSGGEKQSLALAGTLAMQPKILALDEPNSMLDPIGRARVVGILKTLAAEANTTILMAEQNPELIIDLADRVLLLDQGHILLDGSPRQVYSETDTLQQIGVKLPPMLETFSELQHRRLWNFPLPFTVKEAVSSFKEKAMMVDTPAVINPEGLESQAGNPNYCIKVQNIDHHFDQEVFALKGVSVQFHPGEFTAIIGQNGSGKSTLSHHLVGILRPTNTEGRVYVDNLDVSRISVKELIRHINYVFQNPDDQLFQETVHSEIEYGLINMGLDENERKKRLDYTLNLFGLTSFVDISPKSLDRGLRTKTTIAAVVAMQPNILVVDEPTTGLDYRDSLEIQNVLENLAQAGQTVIFVTHEMDLVARFARRVIVMHAGKILFDGSPASTFSQVDVLKQASISPPDIYQFSEQIGWHNHGINSPIELADRLSPLLRKTYGSS